MKKRLSTILPLVFMLHLIPRCFLILEYRTQIEKLKNEYIQVDVFRRMPKNFPVFTIVKHVQFYVIFFQDAFGQRPRFSMAPERALPPKRAYWCITFAYFVPEKNDQCPVFITKRGDYWGFLSIAFHNPPRDASDQWLCDRPAALQGERPYGMPDIYVAKKLKEAQAQAALREGRVRVCARTS